MVKTITLDRISDIKNYLTNIGLVLATKNLEYHGFYTCKIEGQKHLFKLKEKQDGTSQNNK